MWASLPPLALGWLGLDCARAVAAARANGCVAGPPAVSRAVPGRTRILARVDSIGCACRIRLLYLGWLALSAYLAIYLPIFVGLSRVAVHRLSVPLWLAAPVVWTGLELARAHLLTGFLMASLAHTQVNWTMLIQISDLVGEYGVDFVVMLVAACIASLIPLSASRIADMQTIRNPQANRHSVAVGCC